MSLNRREFMRMVGWGTLGTAILGFTEMNQRQELAAFNTAQMGNREQYFELEGERAALDEAVSQQIRERGNVDPLLRMLTPQTAEEVRLDRVILHQEALDRQLDGITFRKRLVTVVNGFRKGIGLGALGIGFGNGGLTERDWIGEE